MSMNNIMTIIEYPNLKKLKEDVADKGVHVQKVKVVKDEKYINDMIAELSKHGIKLREDSECSGD